MKRNILLSTLILLFNLSALSQPGTLDNTFGNNGRLTLPVGDYEDFAYGAAIQQDGKIVIAGYSRTTVNDPNFGNRHDFSVVRLNPDGTLDASFDGPSGIGNGKVIIPVGDYGGVASAIVIQPDGKILIAGYAHNLDFPDGFTHTEFAVIRLKPDGDLDQEFGVGGKKYIQTSDLFSNSVCAAIALQTDGKIVLAGRSVTSTLGVNFDRVFTAVRLNSDGNIDLPFGGNNTGIKYIPIMGVSNDAVSSIAIQPDGDILIAGYGSTTVPELAHFAVARLNDNGTTDFGFGDNGQTVLFTNNSSFCNAMALQPDGRILLAGGSGFTAATGDFQIVRLESNGLPDNNFDGDGRVLVPVGSGIDEAYAMALQPDGKIVVAGHSQVTGSFNFSAIRLNSTGTLDICFDGDGKTILPSATATSFGERSRALALQADGNIVLAGINLNFSNGNQGTPEINFIIMRINGGSGSALDNDGDGYNGCVDCNDNNPNVNPGATEICNGIDDDCDGQVDEGLALVYYRDLDGDGFGDPNSQPVCSAQAGYVTNNTDCNDNNAAVHPNAIEVCNNIDDDCDGQIDEGVKTTFYKDNDGDGFGNPNITTQACSVPATYVSNNSDCDDTKILYADNDNDGFGAGSPAACGVENNTDCNDNNATINSPIIYYQDGDNDGFGNPSNPAPFCQATPPQGYAANNFDCDDTNLLYVDVDNDGYGAGAPAACGIDNNLDCDDTNPGVRPNATESCNGIDDDCDGLTDEGIPTFTYYLDTDGDGWGIASQTKLDCRLPAGYASNPGDCNDGNPAIHPGATELCNGIDEDCDGLIDDGALQPWYLDNDGDGYGNSNQFLLQCTQPQNYVSLGGDCNDNNVNVHPNATELCNGIDDDCDNSVDEGLTLNTYYKDDDGDGYGIMVTIQACSPPQGYASLPGDCNDNNVNIHPNATEVCNGIDDDCDNSIDEGLQTTWYRDNDSDGYGNPNASLTQCLQPQGYITNSGDCNDNDPDINPAAIEICNEKDDDCDGQIDEGFTKTTYYKDADNDGYGDANNSLQACTQPFGYVLNNTDCDDGNDTIHPNATEYCNGIDENCNGIIDDNPVLVTWYRDADNDGWGNPNVTVQACTPPAGYIRESFDCDDTDAEVHPEATEISNDKDDDCDGQIDEGALSTFYRDLDGDTYGDPANSTQAATQPQGYVSNNTDCNDNPGTGGANIHPGATEVCNNIDDDCDGQIDEGIQRPLWYIDFDGDGYGATNSIPAEACTAPLGYVAVAGDCNDNDNTIHPEATEVCNLKDDDCDGLIDEEVEPTLWYIDEDGDGYGATVSIPALACTAPPGYVAVAGDCNDNDNAIHPGATEICNLKDDDCDGQIDEGVEPTLWYIDEDGDGYGATNSIPAEACTLPLGYVAVAGDCDDNDASINPNTVWYLDVDNDNYYTGSGVTQCTSPGAGYKRTGLIAGGDCNDNNGAVHPGATEVCNNIDDDCDGQIDEGVKTTFYRDADGDGFGDPNSTSQACTAPLGYVNNNTDCNDNPATGGANIHPGATEVCNNIDDDCDGQIDDGVKTTFYRDADSDGFGNPNNTTQGCTAPSGYVSNNSDCDDTKPLYADNDGDGFGAGSPVACGVATNTDCNDANAAINPNTVWYLDADNDNYYTGSSITQCTSPGTGYKIAGLIAGGDCNDNNNAVNPGATEVCGNSIDENCNGSINESCATTVSINSISVYESEGIAMLTVSLTSPLSQNLKVNYQTIDGTADSKGRDKDFKAVKGSVTIPAGQTAAQINITIYNDVIVESTEHFTVQISLPNGVTVVTIGQGVGQVQILDGTDPSLTMPETKINTQKLPAVKIKTLSVKATPNPYITNFNLVIQSAEPGKARIEFFTLDGRKVHEINKHVPGNTITIIPYNGPLRFATLAYKVTIGKNIAAGIVLKPN